VVYLAYGLIAGAVFALAAAVAGVEDGSWGRHIGSGLLIGAAAYYGPSLLAGPDVYAELPWGVYVLLVGVAAWLTSLPWNIVVYSADLRQAALMSTIVAAGFMLLALFARWAMSTI